MSLVVPFDGSRLSQAALVRAAQFDTVLNEGVVVVSVIPKGNTRYARERGWIDSGEQFDAEAVVAHLRDAVAELAPDAEFQHVFVDRYAPRGTIAGRIRRVAREKDASIVFVGSDNAGRIVTGITVGQSVAGDGAYDTFVVTREELPEIEVLEEELPADGLLS
ncbi:universal stress protein [Halobellus marinus]|uniref:universal stress protein n=1 Tax=Halobellus TaxID=1073986 RepID=UPI0028A6EA69|nr:universal stress protein [Halobellus sp. DFY28]